MNDDKMVRVCRGNRTAERREVGHPRKRWKDSLFSVTYIQEIRSKGITTCLTTIEEIKGNSWREVAVPYCNLQIINIIV